ncbi:MAG TPA: methylated-DNA--[protein]-cysteine S-methyltransferase [Roseomonas sp.]
MKLLLDHVASPVGTMLVVSDGEALRALDFHDYAPRMHRLLRLHYGAYALTPGESPAAIRDGLHAYFEGELPALDRLPVRTGGTAFQRSVWAALRPIPAGMTTTYGRLAQQLGKPAASRAVGMANGANPIAIVVPCHRVVGANASLTGYGGGLPRKAWLLAHEQRHATQAA